MDSNIIITETPTLSGKSISESISEQISTSSSSQPSSWNFLKIARYILIVIILLFLAYNLFSYLGKNTKGGTNVMGNIGTTVGKALKQTANNTVKGTKGVVNIGANTIGNTMNKLEDATKNIVHKSSKSITSGVNQLGNKIEKKYGKEKRNKIDDNNQGVGQALNDATKKYNNPSPPPVPDDAGSRTQSNQVSNKTGYCYIGEDRGFRSCIKVNESDTCMSGDIFPTRDICIHPNLRQ
tara:strand:- start:1577 stop:2290 length:714 start_codon:yes stop_codon:yes gene_type:complete